MTREENQAVLDNASDLIAATIAVLRTANSNRLLLKAVHLCELANDIVKVVGKHEAQAAQSAAEDEK